MLPAGGAGSRRTGGAGSTRPRRCTWSTPPSSAPWCSSSQGPHHRRRRCCPPMRRISMLLLLAVAAMALVQEPMQWLIRLRFMAWESRAVAAGGRWGRCTRSAWTGPTPTMITNLVGHMHTVLCCCQRRSHIRNGGTTLALCYPDIVVV